MDRGRGAGRGWRWGDSDPLPHTDPAVGGLAEPPHPQWSKGVGGGGGPCGPAHFVPKQRQVFPHSPTGMGAPGNRNHIYSQHNDGYMEKQGGG